MRHIKLKNEILRDCKFQKCIEESKCEFTIEDKDLKKFMNEILHTFQKNEASKGSLVKRILDFAVEANPFLLITNEYYISNERHIVKADHTVSHILSQRLLLISSDKEVEDDLFGGLIQNFDQLKTYSLTEEGSQYPFIYGITSSFNEWRICCYHAPKPGIADSAESFYVSDILPLMGDNLKTKNVKHAFLDFDKRFKRIVGFIKGLLRSDIDKIVAREYSFYKKYVKIMVRLNLDINIKKVDDLIKKQIKDEEKYITENEDDLLLLMDKDILTAHTEGQKKLKTDS